MCYHVRPKIDKTYILVFVIAVFLSWIAHELAHWITGEYLGYKMAMTLNSAYPLSGFSSKDSHYQIISAAGPIFTLIEAAFIYVLMLCKKRVHLYPILFTCFYLRLLATILSFKKPNDEARISIAVGFGKFTLPLLMTAILFLLVVKISKIYKFELKFNLVNLGLVILFSSIIILADMYFKVRLL